MAIPTIETRHLVIREYTLAEVEVHHRLMAEAFDSDDTLEETRTWMEWTVRNYRALERLYQPAYGDHAVVLKETGVNIGSVGLVQTIVLWGVFPEYQTNNTLDLRVSPEFGLFWAVFKAYRGKGYAGEAGKAIMDFVFNVIGARRVVATTEHDNYNSIRVMEKIGMTIKRNPGTEPFWFKVIGVKENG